MKRKMIAGWLAAFVITGLLMAADPAWQSPDESTMGLAAQNEKDPVKQLQLLKTWEQQYPNSDFRNSRTLMQASALLNIVGASFAKTDAPSIEAGRKAAQQLIDHFSTYFDAGVKPATLSDEQWSAVKKTTELQAHGLLAQVAVIGKDDATAETEYKKILAVDPTQAATSYQLGSAILWQMSKSGNVDPARYSEALYDLARSLSVTGPNALPPDRRPSAESFLRKNYSNYHGDSSGLDDLIKQAIVAPLPSGDFHILSIVDLQAIKARDHAAWAAAHPDLDLWETLQNQLSAQGDTFFAASLKDVQLPPAAGDTYKGPAMFQATVVSATPKQLVVNVDNVAGDAILKFDDVIKGEIPAGTAIRFKGVVDAWTKDPTYVLTFVIQEPKSDIAGLPDGVTFAPEISKTAKPGGYGKASAKNTRKAQ